MYKLNSAGQETVLYTFTGGASPDGTVIRGSGGNLFGTTAGGGAFDHGVVFELNAAGQETVLYSFTGGADGASPIAAVIRDTAGNFYGTTYEGGMYSGGVLFKIKPQ